MQVLNCVVLQLIRSTWKHFWKCVTETGMQTVSRPVCKVRYVNCLQKFVHTLIVLNLCLIICSFPFASFNPLTPNDHYSGRTASLTSKRCILYISTNIGTEYFKHGIYSPLFSSSKCILFHNSNVFSSCIIHILYTGVPKLKKIIPAPKG